MPPMLAKGSGAGNLMPQDHWLPGFNFNVEESFEGDLMTA
jgi:hypothetical protein